MNAKRFLQVAVFLFFCVQQQLFAQELKPHGLFSNDMVLQRNQPCLIYGEAAPDTEIDVTLAGKKLKCRSDVSGYWEVSFSPMSEGGPHQLSIKTATKEFNYKNILFGDVWLASGQSNMEYKMSQNVLHMGEELKAAAEYSEIRQVSLPNLPESKPKKNLPDCEWKVSNSEHTKEFSAVAYFFAKKVYNETKVPIGIINATWGGSTIESWMHKETLANLPHLAGPDIPEINSGEYDLQRLQIENDERVSQVQELTKNSFTAIEEGVLQVKYDDSPWKTAQRFPTNDAPNEPNIWWMRRMLNVPEKVTKDTLYLSLGVPSKPYSVYFNGHQLDTGDAPQCRVKIDPDFIKKGQNILVVRVANPWWSPILGGSEDDFFIASTNKDYVEKLNEGWVYTDSMEPKLPIYYNVQHVPSGLYNGMIHPLLKTKLKGVIWYQGENNGHRGLEYNRLFSGMISDWRIRWKQGYFPFLYVQLANLGKPNAYPEEQGWPFLREAQTNALHLPQTGMAVTLDVGNADDIHPKDKRTVGNRLARNALRIAYNKDVVASGPMYVSDSLVDSTIVIRFDHAQGLQTTNQEPLKGFSIAGEDHIFYLAKGMIVDNKVILSSDDVKEPLAVRYAWAINPICNLFNEAGLPAVPFRTDDWDWIKTAKD